ncbi:hypothetical protein BCR39DRAFT_556212 [Naematelia encephala]|uniref:Uncharacterized protein n=1 Tax=Naematelia encephala TaxID=71784 RepID=A0A1Y2BJD7_9TREE|nr:hypothetical protein BCR39DRAFT_556212 [Naematelia encephala]
MAIPIHFWGAGPSPPGPQFYGIPQIPPSSHPMVVDPALAIRDYTEHALNGDRRSMCDETSKKLLESWSKTDEYRAVIVDVVKTRLDLGWPYNYKALDILSFMPLGDITGLYDKLKALSESPASVEGAAELKKAAKPFVDKVDAEKKKAEDEEASKKQQAIAAMWGGLWADDATRRQAQIASAGWGGWPYPWLQAPGVSAQAVAWPGKGPEGWQPSSITPMPQVYPFSRSGYYALRPPDEKPPEPPKANQLAGVWLGPPA